MTLLYFWGLLFPRMIFFYYFLPVFRFPFQDFAHFWFQYCGWLAFPDIVGLVGVIFISKSVCFSKAIGFSTISSIVLFRVSSFIV